MARITPKQAEEMLNAYSDVYTDLEERVQDVHEKYRSQAIQNYLNRKKAAQDLNNKVDKIEKETGQDFSKGARMSNPNLTPSSSFNKNNNNNNNNNNNSSNNTVTSKGGQERTVTKNDDGSINIQKGKDLDAQTDDLIANTPTIKGKSQFSGRDAKADLGSYKSIFDKGNNSNAKGNPIGGNNEGGPKGNPISTQSNNNQSNNNQPGSGSRQVKPGLIGRLLPNHPGNKTGNNQQQTGNNQQQTGNNQQARPGRTVGAPQGSGKPGSLVRVQGNQNKPNLGDRIKSGIGRLGSMAANTISRAKTSLSNQGPIQGRQTGAQRRAAQTSQRTQQTGNNQQQTGNNNHPSTAEIRAKAKASGQSGLSNIPSKEGNAVINNKPINPDFGKKPVVQSTGAKVGGDGGRAAWLKKTANSPAARSGAFSDDQRWAQRQKHLKFQADRKAAQAAKQGATSVKPQQPLNNSYESIGDYFDETVHFLVSEGHVQNESEAISIMSTPEFISGFEKGLNESFENNK
jgi:hypothetical protein